MEIKDKIKNLINEALSKLDISGADFSVEHPDDLKNGDYSTNAAMVYAKKLRMNPKELAEKIVATLKHAEAEHDFIEEVSVAGAGFINFYLSQEFLTHNVERIIKEADNFGKNELFKGQKILVEHSSPNLFKAFHIGHVMNNAIGESITRLARYSDADVKIISYPSDVSLGIAKAVWALMEDGGLEKIRSMPSASAIAYFGECYVKGSRSYDDNTELQPRIREIASLIYNKTDGPEYKTYLEAKEINLAYFKTMTATLGSKFDDFIFESEAGVEGEKLVKSNIGSIFKESEGAVIYEGEQDGLHTRVFINKEGYPTYEAKDVGLLSLKFARYKPDLSIFITDHEQSEYFKVVVTAAGKINPLWKDRTVHRTHGRMSFKGQKMSSRLGGVPSAQELFDVMYEELNTKNSTLAGETGGDGLRQIAVSALKFPILRSVAGKNIDFDPETSLSFEGASGPYLQYSTVRAKSILDKAFINQKRYDTTIPAGWSATPLEHYLVKFPEVVEQATHEWEPHHIVTYLLELSQTFNSWYGNTKIIEAEGKESQYKIALTKSFYQTMKNGLYLLGIETPEKM